MGLTVTKQEELILDCLETITTTMVALSSNSDPVVTEVLKTNIGIMTENVKELRSFIELEDLRDSMTEEG